jgi:hypothetical protein
MFRMTDQFTGSVGIIFHMSGSGTEPRLDQPSPCSATHRETSRRRCTAMPIPVWYSLPVPRHGNGRCRGAEHGAEHGGRYRAHPVGRRLRSDLLKIAFLPRYPDDEELEVASAVIYE